MCGVEKSPTLEAHRGTNQQGNRERKSLPKKVQDGRWWRTVSPRPPVRCEALGPAQMLQLESAPLYQRSTRAQNRPIAPYKGAVYAITRFGLGVLESYVEGLVSVSSGSRNLPSILQAPHFLELNEIYLALKRTKRLKRWKSERELISLNYVIGMPLAKDYDAIAEVEINGDSLRLAIEYERTLE
jgi:hypothetical protein